MAPDKITDKTPDKTAIRKNRRPKNLNLLSIRLPIPALVSIMHRVSGAFLFLLLPLLLWVFQQSVISAEGYAKALHFLHHPLIKLVCILVVWAFLHHACAGLRHLALDAHYGLKLTIARASSQAVLIISGLLTIWIGVWLW